jgi:hypothetical protein
VRIVFDLFHVQRRMDPSSCRQLALLIVLSGIPLACAGDDTSNSSNTDAGATTTRGTDGAATKGAATKGTDATGTDATSTESSNTDATSDPTTTSGPTETSGDTGQTTGGTTDGTVCQIFADFYVDCGGDETYREALEECEEFLKYALLTNSGAQCIFASVDLIECQIEHTCRDLEQGLGCEPEHTEVELACIPKPEETCTIYRAKYEECGGTDENVDIECQIEINDGIYFKTLECGLAVGDYYACLGGLDCADLLGNTGCEQESSAVDDLCWR